MSSSWENLIELYKNTTIEATALKSATVAQWILESGHGQSELAQQHLNFAGLKFRAEMVGLCEPIDYEAHDGIDTYCKFADIESFISGYWAFINRRVYEGWQDYKNNPAGYIRFLHSRGYTGDPGYVSKVVSLFDETDELLDETSNVAAPTSTNKLAVIVGHNDFAEGAFAANPLANSEFDYNNVVANKMAQASPEYNFDVKVINRLRSTSARREIKAAYRKADNWGAEVIVELHFNAAADGSANGTETLVRDRSDARVVAKAVQTEMVETLQLHNRGIKVRGPSDRGGISLHASEAVSVLVEPFFGSNRDDRIRIASVGEDALARTYLRGLRSGLGQFAF